MEVDNLRTLRYCKMSGMDIKRRTLRKRRPAPGGNVDKLKVDLTDPSAVKEDADKHGRDGEVVNEAADLEHEVEFVRCRHKLTKSFLLNPNICCLCAHSCFDIKLRETDPFVDLIWKTQSQRTLMRK